MTTDPRQAYIAQIEGRVQEHNQDGGHTPFGVFEHHRVIASKGYNPPASMDATTLEGYKRVSYNIPETLADALDGLLRHEGIDPDVFAGAVVRAGLEEIVKNPRYASQLKNTTLKDIPND